MVPMHSHCIVGCGWLEIDESQHGPYCERTVGSNANGVTEPEWKRTQFWCSVISRHLRGEFPLSYVRDTDRYRDGVQLLASVEAETVPVTCPYPDSAWQEVRFNLTAAEARSLAAQLVAAADSSDGIGKDAHLMHRLEKIADHVGANIWGA